MAAKTSNDLVDYLGEYRRYFEEFVKKINPEDQLPMKVNAYSITETELIGEIIYLTLQYIKQPRCPRNLQGYLVRLVLQEIKELCEKQPEECGFKLETKSYAPLKLMQAVTSKVNEIFTRYLDNSRLAMLPPPSSKLPPLARSAALKNGKRKMEDRHVEIYDLHTICNVQNDSLASYFAVFDGHGGEDAAVYCATHLHQYLAESIYYPTDPERALCDAFHTTDTRFIEKERTQKVIGGTTAVCVLLLDKKLYIAWVGDSLAMLVKRGKVEELVYPHRLSRYDESERIQQMGGMLAFNQGTVRVNGVLAVSRAIGDVQYKPYVTSTPDTRCISLDGTEDFLIIATDGVWDFVNTYDAAMIVYVAIREYPDDPNYAVTSLIKAAKHAGSLDNITAIVVFLTAPSDIVARSSDANSVLVVKSMKNMAVNNPYVQKDLSDGMFFKQMKQYQQQHQQPYDNDQEERHANGSEETAMDDGGFHDEITGGGADGKHEENDAADYIYEDLGPETDVDAVDDVDNADNLDNLDNVHENPLLDNVPAIAANLSDGIFLEGKNMPKCDENNFQEENAALNETLETTLDDDDSPANNDIKALQHALLPEADNVADSEDSEDEWNYYRVGPNKEKDTVASSEELHEIKNDNEIKNVEHLDEDNNVEEPPRSPTSEHNSSSECESQKGEEILPELINTDISVEEKREIDSAFVKLEKEEEEEQKEVEKGEAEEEEKEHGVEEGEGEEEKKEHSEEKEEEKEEKEGGGDEEEEDKQEQEEDMDFQLNPNAAEFIPISPPKRQIKINTINDSLVAGSPLKTIAMDDIKVPSQKEFDEEISARPHEIEEEDSSPNGDHATPFDYDFYTEQQKVINPLSAAAAAVAAGLDESEISSTKAEYGDETMSFLCTTTTDLHKTEISTMEESFGDSDCDIYNRDNPMTMSYTPCDFKAAFNKEVDLNAVHDLSDGDLEDENCSSEGQTPQSPKVILSTDIEERRTEFDTLSNGDSSSQVQTASLLSKDDATFLKFEDSNEPKTTEFIQVELERHRQSSPIKFEQDFSKEEEEKSSPLLENKDEMIHVVTREKEEEKEEEEEEEKEKEKEKENERVETPKEAEYIDDEKDNIATDNDIITNSDSEFIVDKPIEIATDLIQSEILQDTISQEQHNFLSSTIDESLRSVSPSMPSIEREFIGTSPEPLKNDLIASMENLTLAKEEKDRPIMVSNLYSNVSEYQPNQSSFDLFASGEPALSDISSKPSLLDDSMDLIAQTVPKEHPESCFLPTPISEPISNDRPIENLLELKETTTEVPITDHIEESKAEECPKSSSSFEDIVEKPSQLMEESVCFFDTNKHIDLSQDIHLKLEDSSETKPTDKIEINVNEFEKINGTVALNLSESIQEFTGLEKQLEPENITPEESPMTETAPLVEDKITKEDILEHEEPVAQEAVEEKLLLDTKEEGEEEEEGLEAKEDVEIVQVAETTRSVGTTELTEFSKSTELVTPVENVEIEKASDAFELVTPVETTEISTPTDTEKTVVSTDIVESEISEKIIEITKPIDTTTMGIIDTAEVAGTTEIAGTAEIAGTGEITETALIADATEIVGTAEIAETADTAKTIDISEDVSVTQDIEKQEVTEPVKVEESQKIEGEAAVEQPAVAVVATEGIVAAAAAATAAGLVTTVAATSTSNKAKAKPTTKSMKPGSSASTKAAAPKSTPTSPSKTVSSTTRPTTSATTTKKPAGTAAARPKHLDTTATKSQTSTNTAKSSATKTVSASKTSTTATSTTKTAARPSSALTKSKPASASARSTTTSTVEKKSILNGDVKSLSKTTVTKAATKSTITSTSTAAKTSTSKTTTGSRTSSSTTTATTTTALSTTGKSRPTSAITAAKSPAKSAGTNAASSSLNATKSKATTTSNNTAKTRTSLAKSPMIDKQIKETANKQISMARTTSSPMSKTTTRSSMSATTILNANTITSTTKRLSSQKSTSTTVAHSPVKKVTSKVASGHSSGATTTKSSSTTKVKVMQNGTADNVEITKTATTIITTNSKNEDDVPKKDLSPVVAHTDNQLISSAD